MAREKSRKSKITDGQDKYCAPEKNFCIQKKKYKDELEIVTDYLIYPSKQINVLECLNNSNSISGLSFKKVNTLLIETNSKQAEKLINNQNEIVDENVVNDKVFNLYLNLATDTYKYVIELDNNKEMDYYRLVRIACHAVKDLLEKLQHEHDNKKKREMAKKERKEAEGKKYKMNLKFDYEPIERFKHIKIISFGLGIYDITESDDEQSKSEETLRNPREIIIDYDGLDPNETDEMRATI